MTILSTIKTSCRSLALASPFILASTQALAHTGPMAHHHSSFASGLTHPITGLDHLLMLVGFGIFLKLTQGSKQQMQWAGAGLLSLVAGLMAGQAFGGFSGVELMISASLFVVATGIWFAFSSKKAVTKAVSVMSVMSLFFHGYAHGIEAQGDIFGFGLGMLVAAAGLIALGRLLGRFVATPWVGAGVAASAFAIVAS
ncbi:MAG: HupE/UreJ family protein [Vibrio sp.]